MCDSDCGLTGNHEMFQERAERAEAEVEYLKNKYGVARGERMWALDAERALADRLAEALNDLLDDQGSGWTPPALAAYEAARQPITTTPSTGLGD